MINWGGFDKTEVCGTMVRNFMGPGSPNFCLTESSNLQFAWFTVNLNFNVLEMALKALRCPGSPQNTFICSSLFQKRILQIIFRTSTISKSGNLKIGKPKFTNECQKIRERGSYFRNMFGFCWNSTRIVFITNTFALRSVQFSIISRLCCDALVILWCILYSRSVSYVSKDRFGIMVWLF